MIFESLAKAALRGELILVEGGLCHWHLRSDGQITIREIIVLPEHRGKGVGTGMLNELKRVEGARSIFAKCPVDLEANAWYAARGFTREDMEIIGTGRKLNLWRLVLGGE